MARKESDREDLMREARALRRRIELRRPGRRDTVVAGFRRDGALSIYFGPDPVYHFDAGRRLRRAFLDGCLYRTQGTTLAQLTRVRTQGATELRRRDLSSEELREFLSAMAAHLEELAGAIEEGTASVVAQVPTDDAISPDLRAALRAALAAGPSLAPPIKGKP